VFLRAGVVVCDKRRASNEIHVCDILASCCFAFFHFREYSCLRNGNRCKATSSITVLNLYYFLFQMSQWFVIIDCGLTKELVSLAFSKTTHFRSRSFIRNSCNDAWEYECLQHMISDTLGKNLKDFSVSGSLFTILNLQLSHFKPKGNSGWWTAGVFCKNRPPSEECRRTPNANVVCSTHVCLRLVFICWKGQHYLVFSPFQQIKLTRATMNELTARKLCIRRSAKYPRLELRVTKWLSKIQISASLNRKNPLKSSTTDEKQPSIYCSSFIWQLHISP